MESQYQTRTFIDGDEAKLIRLFNEAHDKYAGFVPRTEDYWRWCCRDRPDVVSEGIIVMEEKKSGKIVGYTVVGKSGNVWELCVDPSADRKYVVSVLFENAISYLRKVNADQMVLNVPSDDLVMQEACAQMDFFELPPDQMFVGITDFEALVGALAKNAKERLGDFRETVTFRLLNARYWINPVFSVRIDGGVQVFENAVPSGFSIEVDSDVLAAILLGSVNPFAAVLKGKLKVNPFWKFRNAVNLLNALQMHNSWFYSLADYG
jgi:putative sterol carrier protein